MDRGTHSLDQDFRKLVAYTTVGSSDYCCWHIVKSMNVDDSIRRLNARISIVVDIMMVRGVYPESPSTRVL